MSKILIVDDEGSVRRTISTVLGKKGYAVQTASDGKEALQMISDDCFDLVITDLNMPGMGGMELLKRVKEYAPEIEVLILTAYGSVESAVEATKIGAYDYVSKPIQSKDIAIRVQNALERKNLKSEVKHLRQAVAECFSLENLIGQNTRLKNVLQTVEKVLAIDTAIIIQGESGTGKKHLARAIHTAGPRRGRPFISIDCEGLRENTLEEELFGYARGAFSGAERARQGMFEQATGGTVFLNEVSVVPVSVQVKLLQLIQDKGLKRLGSGDMTRIDVRVIAATRKKIPELVKEGRLRKDLYYQLTVLPISLPPLRERIDDIPLLTEYFLDQFNEMKPGRKKEISPEAFALLQRYDWPGNVRELKNALERAVAVSAGPVIEPEDLPPAVRSGDDWQGDRLPRERISLKEMEKDYISLVLRGNNWDRVKAARNLGITRDTLRRKIRQYELERAEVPG